MVCSEGRAGGGERQARCPDRPRGGAFAQSCEGVEDILHLCVSLLRVSPDRNCAAATWRARGQSERDSSLPWARGGSCRAPGLDGQGLEEGA